MREREREGGFHQLTVAVTVIVAVFVSVVFSVTVFVSVTVRNIGEIGFTTKELPLSGLSDIGAGAILLPVACTVGFELPSLETEKEVVGVGR